MDLFDECLEALGERKEILSEELTVKYFNSLSKQFPITSWARIDWEKVKNKKRIEYSDELFKWLKDNGIADTSVIILWNPSDDPAVKTTLENALAVIDDVTAVGSDTFMYSELGYVIEFYHDGEVTVGMAN
ncbi:CDI toxin immunity protein [Bacillus sp. FSL M8-0168]|uniref:CDI toxin immunity protein n=1 Tax=Bacillus sp. FSL M8-0168 TaxID=2921614 RepID=UPI0030FD5863